MKQKTIRKWARLGLIASLSFCGCAHHRNQQQSAAAPTAAPCSCAAQTAPPPAAATPQLAELAQNPTNAAPEELTWMVPETSNNPAVTRGEPPPARRSFVDTTAQPFFDHAADYTWLQGQVEYSHLSKAWRLRYAPVDSEDVYGGSVTLEDGPLVKNLKDGQYVRVEGCINKVELVQTGTSTSFRQDRSIAPLYRVDGVKPIQQ
jgi:hypothetical protein